MALVVAACRFYTDLTFGPKEIQRSTAIPVVALEKFPLRNIEGVVRVGIGRGPWVHYPIEYGRCIKCLGVLRMKTVDSYSTLEDVALEMGVTQERIRQIENVALRKCRGWCTKQGYRIEDLLGDSQCKGTARRMVEE